MRNQVLRRKVGLALHFLSLCGISFPKFFHSLFLESVLQCPTAGTTVTFSAKSRDAS